MASSSLEKVSMLKKTSEDETSSDSDSSMPDIECETCGLSFSDIKSYDSHLKGKKHHKKVAQVKFLAKHKMNGVKKEDNKANSGDDVDDDDDDDLNEIHCDVCDKSFTGYISYNAHLKGRVHAKYVKKQKLKVKVKEMPGVLPEDDKVNSEEDDVILPKLFARCSTCQKDFSGPEPFSLHMKSTVHKKKVQQSKLLEGLKSKNQDESKKSDDEDDIFSNCDVCEKSFSGPVPYQIHMSSSVHKKNLEKKKVAEEMKEYYSKDNAEVGYVCKECKKVFTDPVAFKYHLTNNSHEKQKAKTALLEFLNAYPEIEFVTPFGDENTHDSDSSSQDYYLICKVCHVSFSGPESAEDHVKSKKHISVKRDKQRIKLMKQQKQKDSDSVKVKDKNTSLKTDVKANKLPQNGNNSTNGKTDEPHAADDFEMV